MLRVLLNVLVSLLHRLCRRVVPQRLLQLAELVVPRGALPLVAPHARLAQPLLHAQAAARRLHWLRRLLRLLLLVLVGVDMRVSVHVVVGISMRVSMHIVPIMHIVMLLLPMCVVVPLLPVRVVRLLVLPMLIVVLFLPVRVVRLLVLPILVVVLFLPVRIVRLSICVVVLLLPVRIVGLLLMRVGHLWLLLLHRLLLLHWLLLTALRLRLRLRLLRLAALLGGGIGGVQPRRAARQVSTQVCDLLQPELLLHGG